MCLSWGWESVPGLGMWIWNEGCEFGMGIVTWSAALPIKAAWAILPLAGHPWKERRDYRPPTGTKGPGLSFLVLWPSFLLLLSHLPVSPLGAPLWETCLPCPLSINSQLTPSIREVLGIHCPGVGLTQARRAHVWSCHGCRRNERSDKRNEGSACTLCPPQVHFLPFSALLCAWRLTL